MKKNHALLCLILVYLLFNGCNKKEVNELFSCDASINQWVIENRSELMQTERKDLVKYPLEHQRAIFRALTDKRKAELWEEKLLLLSNYQYYNETCVLLINEISAIMTENRFSQINPVLMDSIVNKIWTIQRESLQGSITIYIDFGTFFTHAEFSRYISMMTDEEEMGSNKNDVPLAPPGPKKDCNCKWQLSCTIIGAECVEGLDDCIETEFGCGFLYLFDCNGRCEYKLHD